MQAKEEPGHVDSLDVGYIQADESISFSGCEDDMAMLIASAKSDVDPSHPDLIESTGGGGLTVMSDIGKYAGCPGRIFTMC
jgi:hypothetical protein